MRHDETTLVAFLDGSLSRARTEAFDRHLLECTECWTAVLEDQRGQLALAQLNDAAPPELGDAISLAIGLQPAAAKPHPRRRLRVLVGSATAAVLIAITILTAYTVNAPPSPHDSFSAVTQLAAASSPTRGRGRLVTLDGRQVLAVAHRVPAGTALVLMSTGPLSMPANARPYGRTGNAWAATRGRVRILCITTGRSSLLAGQVPLRQLSALAQRLGLT